MYVKFNDHTTIKKAFRIVGWSILSLCILVLAIYFLLELSPVQQKIKTLVLQEITKKTKNAISIGNLRLSPFNRLQLEDIYANDLKNDTLLYVKKINADFDLLKLFRKQFVIRSVEIDHIDLRISKDSINAPFNFQFLADAFASDTTQTSENSKIHLAIDHILLKEGRLRYDVFSEPSQPSGMFDASHIDIRNLQFGAKLHYYNPEDWSGSIENISMNETSGFVLKQMKFQIEDRNSQLRMDHFYISLPHSEGEIREATLDYTGLQLSEILSGATYSILFSSGKCYPCDFSCFYPEFAHYTDTLTCSGEIKGKFPEISLPRLELNYGKQLQFKLNADLADYGAWETSPFELNVEKCLIDPELFGLALHTDIVSVTGKITGSLPNSKIALTAKSKQGDLDLNGTAGYTVSSGDISFDWIMESSECNVKNLLSDSIFGSASFRLAAQGTITALNKIEAKADAEIQRLDYRGYSYRDITANAVYANDSVSIDLISKDRHLPVILQGKAGLNKQNAFVQLYIRLDGLRPDVLHLLPQYPGSELSGTIHANIKGFDPDLMTASIVIDHLHWITSAGEFNDSPITFTYNAGADRQKQVDLRSSTLNIRGKGSFTYKEIDQSFKQAFPGLFFSDNLRVKKMNSDRENFDFVVGIRHANTIAHLLGMESSIPDSALFVGKYNKEREDLNLDLTAFCIFTRSDTARVELNLSNVQNNLIVQTVVKNRSKQYNLEGNIKAAIEFLPNLSQVKPDIRIALNSGFFTMNGTTFQIRPAQINVATNRYEIRNFALRHSRGEYIKVDGMVSDNPADSLQITVNRFEIGTVMSALKNNFPLSGTATGEITLSRLMVNPLILTRNLAIDSMVFDGNPIGNLQLRSAWSSERQGLALRSIWTSPNARESVVSGFILPMKDSLALTADVQGIQLKWLQGYLPEIFYGLDGELGAQVKVSGKLNDPVLSGTLYLNDATVGIPMLNTQYRISDSIFLEKDQIVFRNFMIMDETNRNVTINGTIGHRQFLSLNPKLTFDFNRFLVLNNSEQTDSLFYGLIRMNGALSLSLQNKDWLIQGKLSNDKANKIMLNFPESAMEAQRYNWLTFADKQKNDSIVVESEQPTSELSAFSLPLKLQITLSIDPGLSIGAIINPDTKDGAVVTGRGVLDLSYNWADPVPRVMGTYIIDDGLCALSLKNITKKTFSIRPGGKLNFQGDIMNTTFDLSAVYNLRTSLSNLDPSFASIMNASRIPVDCVLAANGKMENMQLQYRIELPGQPDEIQRKLDGLIYSDEIKIREIAYLLAFGSFSPANSMNIDNASLWTSLASSSITSQLNHLLSGILSDNWTIGTDLHSNDSNFSDVDMDVNISTRLFNDRLTLNSTLGYHNNTDQINNFTGDFNIEYKLSPRGNLLLQFYNVTNNQYYNKSRSPLTQGAGIVYKREGRTFRQLFRNLRLRRTGTRSQ